MAIIKNVLVTNDSCKYIHQGMNNCANQECNEIDFSSHHAFFPDE